MSRAHVLAIDLKLKGFYVVGIAIPWESAVQAIKDHQRSRELDSNEMNDYVLVAWPTQIPFPNELTNLVSCDALSMCATLADGHAAYDQLIENT